MSNKTFREKCYEFLKKIPPGKVTTYKEVAKAIGSPKSFRAVGNALHKNPNPFQVPCHRVIRSDGKIGGFIFGVEKKIELLKKEGVNVTNKKIDLKKHLMNFS